MANPQVGIVMGSDSDLEVMSEAPKMLDEFKIPYEVTILSTHRTPEETARYAKSVKSRGLKIIIAGAGGVPGLPGSIAAHSALPVIGVPLKSKLSDGVDSLFSTVSMPAGVPVATVGIDSAKNAAILAAEIIGLNDPKITKKIEAYKENYRKEVLAKNSKLQKIGWQNYLKQKEKK